MLPEPKLLERCSKYKSSIVNVAACIAILFLIKTGVFSSMDKFQLVLRSERLLRRVVTEGQKVIKQYYASRVGEEIANEILSAQPNEAFS